eukprot:TRINITY_DN13368_c0_g1_i1.p1 TRINITY_DN13368_c0_g1~~TRINITY_DN13368_c0_g1_i1.p1  ORF type:complete len:110 (+),score=31.11 TRINITY_DN13368_c0_g1_i1:338-667(+)
MEEIRCLKSPREAFMAARKYDQSLIQPNWDANKLAVMQTALKAKFTQHPDLHKKLIATGTSTLIEHTTNDNFWGDGGGSPGAGQNWLGKLLMQLRAELAVSLVATPAFF